VIPKYEAYQQALDQELRDVFESRQGFLYDVLRYHLGWVDQAKQPVAGASPLNFQAAIVFAACDALANDFHQAAPAAAAVELVHNFTLVHGDVQSPRTVAEDRPSVWWVWGPAQAINAGDGLHALGRTTIMRLAQRGVPAERVLRSVLALDRACLALCEGQFLDLDFQDRLMVTSGAYYDMIGRKTGALAGCAAEIGAVAAGADDAVCDSFHQAGRSLGMAWQLSLDVADLWGQSGDGMTPNNLLNKKKSLPLIHTLENSPVSTKRELGNIYAKRVLEPDDAARIIAILDDANARDFAEEKAAQLAQEALAGFQSAGVSDERLDFIHDLTKWAVEGNG
jgi:geranylgeranyl diphosphate synthase type I